MTFPVPPHTGLSLDELAVLGLSDFRKYFERLFALAFAFCPDKGLALRMTVDVFKELETVSRTQLPRFREKPKGAREKIWIPDWGIAHRCLYRRVESHERRAERSALTFRIWARSVLKHLNWEALKGGNSAWSAVSRSIIFHLNASDIASLHAIVAQNDERSLNRAKDAESIRKMKGAFMRSFKDRFGGMLKEMTAAHGEKRFLDLKNPMLKYQPDWPARRPALTPAHVTLVRHWLHMLTPWIEKFEPGFSYSGSDPDIEQIYDAERIRMILDPISCDDILNAGDLPSVEECLSFPITPCQGIHNEPPEVETPTPDLSDDDIQSAQEELAIEAKLRHGHALSDLIVLVDGQEVTSLNPISGHVSLSLSEGAEVVQIIRRDGEEDVVLATHLVTYGDFETVKTERSFVPGTAWDNMFTFESVSRYDNESDRIRVELGIRSQSRADSHHTRIVTTIRAITLKPKPVHAPKSVRRAASKSPAVHRGQQLSHGPRPAPGHIKWAGIGIAALFLLSLGLPALKELSTSRGVSGAVHDRRLSATYGDFANEYGPFTRTPDATSGGIVSGSTDWSVKRFVWQAAYNGSRIITTIAGSGSPTLAGMPWRSVDGGVTFTSNATGYEGIQNDALGRAEQLTTDQYGNLYIADALNQVILRYSATGTLTVVAGNGISGFAGDGGMAVNASLHSPRGVAVDSGGAIYIADSENRRIRKVDTNGLITTIAGTDTPGSYRDGGAASLTSLDTPTRVVLDAEGNLFFLDAGAMAIRKITPDGRISTIAVPDSFAQPPSKPTGPIIGDIAVTPDGSLYASDIADHVIWKLDPSPAGGSHTTAAGSGLPASTLLASRIVTANADGLVIAPDGSIWFADSSNHRIARAAPDGSVYTVLGLGSAGQRDGTVLEAALNDPAGLAMDRFGNLYIADYGNRVIRKLSDGILQTVIGTEGTNVGKAAMPSPVAALSPTEVPQGDAGTAASNPRPDTLSAPTYSATDSAGNVYVADTLNHRVVKISVDGTLTTVAGTVTLSGRMDGSRTVGPTECEAPCGPATANSPTSPTLSGTALTAPHSVNATGLIPADSHQSWSGQTVTFTVSGSAFAASQNVYVGGPGCLIPCGTGLIDIGSISVPASQSVTVSVSPSGYSSSTGSYGIQLREPTGVAVDSLGNLYIADASVGRVYKRSPDARLWTYAGGGASDKDGIPATDAALKSPMGLALDSSGSLYIADSGNQRIRKVTSSGTITTVAGTGTRGFSGDGGPALHADLDFPSGIAVGANGDLYIADTGNNRIRKLEPSRAAAGGQYLISTFVGTGNGGYNGDGIPAVSATLSAPLGIAFGPDGNLYVADSANSRVRIITPDGTIGTDAGLGYAGFSGDGGAASIALLNFPTGVSIAPDGSVIIVDHNNNRIRKVAPAFAARQGSPLVIAQTGLSFTMTADTAVPSMMSVSLFNSGNTTVMWTANAGSSPGDGDWLQVTPSTGTIAPGSFGSVTVSTQALNLASGAYSQMVTVTNLGPETAASVPVTLAVNSSIVPRPEISPSGLIFTGQSGGQVGVQQFSIVNPTDAVMRFDVQTNSPWLVAQPNSGIIEPHQNVTVIVNASGLIAQSEVTRGLIGVRTVDEAKGTVSVQAVAVAVVRLPSAKGSSKQASNAVPPSPDRLQASGSPPSSVHRFSPVIDPNFLRQDQTYWQAVEGMLSARFASVSDH